MPYTVNVLKHGCCRDLGQALGTACCLKSDEMLLLAEASASQKSYIYCWLFYLTSILFHG
jgi:hypothetical protein